MSVIRPRADVLLHRSVIRIGAISLGGLGDEADVEQGRSGVPVPDPGPTQVSRNPAVLAAHFRFMLAAKINPAPFLDLVGDRPRLGRRCWPAVKYFTPCAPGPG